MCKEWAGMARLKDSEHFPNLQLRPMEPPRAGEGGLRLRRWRQGLLRLPRPAQVHPDGPGGGSLRHLQARAICVRGVGVWGPAKVGQGQITCEFILMNQAL